MVTVDIDELTPCLIDSTTGEIVETEVIRIKRHSFLSKYNKITGWYTDWSVLLKENEIYALVVKGTVSIQGLIAVRPDIDSKTCFVTWMVAAPQNNYEMLGSGKEKAYIGVGGHLFAIAAQKSNQYGFGCAISGFANCKERLDQYCKHFGAEAICMLHEFQFFISEQKGANLMEVYTYEWTDESI